jgi:hypothetical protein
VSFSSFFIFAFYQKISNTAVVKNNQAAERITTVCTYVVGLGEGSSSVFSTLGINVYSPPKDFSQYINWNGSKTAAVVIQKKIYPLSFQQGDIVSLMPTDHIKIPCQGEYLGNVFKQDFDDPNNKQDPKKLFFKYEWTSKSNNCSSIRNQLKEFM